MIKFILTATLSFGFLATVSAQDTSLADDARLVKGVTLDDLEAIVMSLDHIVVSRGDSGSVVSAESEDGLKYLLNGTACDEDLGCRGINMVMTYDLNENYDLESLNKADVAYAAANVWQSDDSIGVSRYVILDGGMTVENIKVNIRTLLALGENVMLKANKSVPDDTPATSSAPELAFGDDAGDYANDATCDDARFHDDGADFVYKRQHVMHDATDCRADLASGAVKLELDFGDNLGDYADDQTCDDVRFEGEGRSILRTDSHIKKDAADCIAEFQAGTISLR